MRWAFYSTGDWGGVDPYPYDVEDIHGTSVASFARALTDNGQGIACVAPEAELVVIRIIACYYGILEIQDPETLEWIPQSFQGKYLSGLEYDDLLSALGYAQTIGADAVNMSFTLRDLDLFGPEGEDFSLLQSAINQLTQHSVDCVVVASAGNAVGEDPHQQLGYPARLNGVIAVGSSTWDDYRAPTSKYWAGQLDVMAPGENVFGAFRTSATDIDDANPGWYYRNFSEPVILAHPWTLTYSANLDGTSFAAPHVAGAAVVIKHFCSGIRVDDVEAILKKTADKLVHATDEEQGAGRIDIGAAVHALEIPDFTVTFYEEPMAKTTAPPGSEAYNHVTWNDYVVDDTVGLPFAKYRLYRRVDGGTPVKIWNDIPKNLEPYNYFDDDISPGHTYTYHVDAFSYNLYQGIDVKGRTPLKSATFPEGGDPPDPSSGQDFVPLPTDMTLEQNYPNPFNPDTQIKFGLPTSSHVRLQIMNIRGQTIRVLIDDEKPAGWHTVMWDGRNAGGDQVASGVYLYLIEADGKNILMRMTLIR